MEKFKTVKEVCKLTGLTRKLLHDYDEQNIVKPTAYRSVGYTDRDGKEYDGYKLYDEEAVIKLQQIAIFRKLRLSRSEIKTRMAAVDYDSNRLLDEQINMLKREKKEIEDLIVVAEQLKLLGMRSELTQYYANMDTSLIVKNVERWQNSPSFKRISEVLEKPTEEIEAEADPILEKLFALTEDDFISEEADKIISELFQIVERHYGLIGWIVLVILAVGGQGDGELSLELSEDIGKEAIATVSKAIISFFKKDLDALWDEFVEIIVQFYDAISKDFDDGRVEEMTIELKRILKMHMGITSKEDYDMFFEFIHYTNLMDDDGYVSNALKALEHYCK